MWETDGWKSVAVVKTRGDWVGAMALSPNGSLLATADPARTRLRGSGIVYHQQDGGRVAGCMQR